MKLKSYNQASIDTTPRLDPAISIHYATGAIRINAATVRLLGLTSESAVEFFQDPTRERDWYIGKSNSDTAFRLRSKSGSFIVYSRAMARIILASLGLQFRGSQSFMVAGKPQDGVYAILTNKEESHDTHNR